MVGQLISKYRVTEQIGRGGMGTVYRAVDETLHRDVAIKVLNAELSDPNVARRFRAEAVTVARLNHPGIATIYELVQHEGQWLMVMEFLRGETLEHLSTRKGPLPVPHAADLCMQALSALAHAHSLGVVHRDLKPANLMLTDDGSVKVMDFGIARVAGAEHLTSAGFMMGTPAYMAPEQVLGGEIDARTDLYSVGVVLYHLVTGKLPFKGVTPIEMAQSRVNDQPTPIRTVRGEVPEWLDQVLGIALARDTGRRFQSALLFREAIRRGLANLPVQTPGPVVIPPELVATAAPGSLHITGPAQDGTGASPIAVEIPKSTAPPAAEMPTVATSLPAGIAQGPGSDAKPRSSGVLGLGLGAAALVVLVAGGVFWFRGRSGSQAEPPPAASVAEAPGTSGTTPAAPSAPVAMPAPTDLPPVEVARGATPPASAPAAAPVTSAGAAAPAASAATTVDGRAGAPPVRGGAPARGRGRGPAPTDPLVAFQDVRAFVVSGKKAEERPAVLKFEAGKVLLAADKGQETYGVLPYAELTSATFVRAKNPRWHGTLAGPPSDVDMPGGLFRTARGWLALQSRNTYVIVRLNDADLRSVLTTVTERTGIAVETVASQ